jgi:Zn-dependent metalloprotease
MNNETLKASLSKSNIKETLKTKLNISKEYEFRNQVIKGTKDATREIDDLGYTHERYDQYYKGIKIEHSDIRIHYRGDSLAFVNGEYIDVPNIDISIALSKDNAIQKAKEYLGAKKYMWEDDAENNLLKKITNNESISYYPNVEIVICRNNFNIQDTTFHVAYKMDISAKDPISSNYIYIDGKTGNILAIEPIIINVDGTAATRYSGIRTISTQQNGSTYRLRDYSRGNGIETYNMNHSSTLPPTVVDFTDNDNNWTSDEYHNANKDDGALDAHWGAMMTYDYFKNVHGRNSYDNNNSVIKNYIHYRTNYDNAGWDRQYNILVYGDGSLFDILTSLDVTSHEIGHGVCQYTANLNYSKESGAINESLSDIWGACVENWVTTDKQTWICGEDLGYPLRSMSNPKLFGQPNTYQSPLSNGFWIEQNGCTPNENNDYCGVHTNSGVMNYWFYLLSQGGNGTNDIANSYNVAGIGIEKAAKIVYRAEVYYMTSNTNFANARTYTIQAASDLYGANSNEVIAVTNAWYAVGVGNPYIEISGPGYAELNQMLTYTILNLPTGVAVTWFCSNNASIVGGNNTGQSVNIRVNSGNTASVSATLSGAIYQSITKNISINQGLYYVEYFGDHAIVYFNHPYAQCYDLEIGGFTSEVGYGFVYCYGSSSLTITPQLTNNYGGYVMVCPRFSDGSSGQWHEILVASTRPVIDVANSELTPTLCYGIGGTFRIAVSEPIDYTNMTSYFWYLDNNFIDATSQPYIDIYTSGCISGTHKIYVCTGISGNWTIFAKAEATLQADCQYGCTSSYTYSAAYPNPAGNELIIDREEKGSEIKANAAVGEQSAKANNATVKVLLYSHSTAKLVYSKDFSASAEQIRIDTSKLPNGVYYLNMIANNEKIKEQTIIVNH